MNANERKLEKTLAYICVYSRLITGIPQGGKWESSYKYQYSIFNSLGVVNKYSMMWTTGDILRATRGKLLCGGLESRFSGISIDSRTITPGDLFIAIKGEVHDGHRFVHDVIRDGIRGVVISEDKADHLISDIGREKKMMCIGVKDTTIALGDMAADLRRRSNASVVAITGSNGKTTTRGMTSSVLSQRFETLSTRGNYNNLIGLPLILLELNPAHKWVVLELGMNRPGEIGRLGDICQPDIGVITNIGPAHLEGFDSIEGIAKAKAELLNTIHPGGTVVLNGDDPRVRRLQEKSSSAVLFFGSSPEAAVRAQHIGQTVRGISFDLVLPKETVPIELCFPGSFMVSNALAAAAVGYRSGLTGGEIKTGLESFRLAEGRMNILHTTMDIHLIDDTYNANPASMEAAITSLKSLKGNARGVLVAGDMLELGKSSAAMHRTIGSIAVQSNVARLYVTGLYANAMAMGARDSGLASEDILVGTYEEIVEDLTHWLKPGDWVLIKGSRKMEMEKIVLRLKEWTNNPSMS